MNHRPATTEPPLGFASATALVVASMIGAGIFTSAGYALAALESPAWVLAAWGIGGVIAVAGAVSYGALSEAISESGGEYVYLARRVHPLVGFLAGWVSLIAGFAAPLAAAATAFGEYAAPLVGNQVSPSSLALALIAICAVQHSLGVEGGARAQNLVVAGKIVGLVLLVACGGWWMATRTIVLPSVEPPRFDLWTFGQQLTWVYVGYSGFNAAVYVSEEIRDPRRNVPRSLLVGTLLVLVLYLGLNFLFVYSAPLATLAGEGDIAAVAFGQLGGPTAEWWCRVLICVALLTSVSVLSMSGPRVYAKMASDGLFPLPVPEAGKPPRIAIALQAGLACLLAFWTGLRQQFTFIGFLLMLCAALAVATLLWVRSDPSTNPPRWWQQLAATLFVVAALVLSALTIGRDPYYSAVAGGITLVVGTALYFVLRCLPAGKPKA